jgi:hypothetical protein
MNIKLAKLVYHPTTTVAVDDTLRYFQNTFAKSEALLTVDYPRLIAVYDSLDNLTHRELLENKIPVAVNGINDDEEENFGIFIPCRHTDEADAILLHVRVNERGVRSFTATTFYPHGLLIGDTKSYLLNDFIDRDTNYVISRFTHGTINKHQHRMLDTVRKLKGAKSNTFFVYPAVGTAGQDFNCSPFSTMRDLNGFKDAVGHIEKAVINPAPTVTQANESENDVYCIESDDIEDFFNRVNTYMEKQDGYVSRLESALDESRAHSSTVTNFMSEVGTVLNSLMLKIEHMDAANRQNTMQLNHNISILQESVTPVQQPQQGYNPYGNPQQYYQPQPQQPMNPWAQQPQYAQGYQPQQQPQYAPGHQPQQGYQQKPGHPPRQQQPHQPTVVNVDAHTRHNPLEGLYSTGEPMSPNNFQGMLNRHIELQQHLNQPAQHSPYQPHHMTQEYSSVNTTQYMLDIEAFDNLQNGFKKMVTRVAELEELTNNRFDKVEETLDNPKPSKAIEADIYRLIRDVRKVMNGEQPQSYNGEMVENGYGELLQDIMDRISESKKIPDVEFVDVNEAIEYFLDALETNSDLKMDNNALRQLFNDA